MGLSKQDKQDLEMGRRWRESYEAEQRRKDEAIKECNSGGIQCGYTWNCNR